MSEPITSPEQPATEIESLRRRVAELESQAQTAEVLRQELRRNEERFRAILEDVQMVAVQGYDQDRRVTFWNRASEELYGYSRAEALGQRLEDLIIPDAMREQVVFHVRRWMEENIPIPAGHLELRRKDGSLVSVYSSHVMQESASGRREMFCVDVDLSEIRAAQERLRQARDEAERANQTKSIFLANMSHEIRTPINGIVGMLQLLRTTPLVKEQLGYLDVAMRSSERLTRLLADILDLSTLEAGKLRLREDSFSLDELQSSMLDLLGVAARAKNIDLRFELNPGLPMRVVGDEGRIQQVLFNLVGNAIKFSPPDSFVRVAVSRLREVAAGSVELLFCVEDRGCGIPDAMQPFIFEPFTQVENSYVRTHQGAGLGLAIVRRLVTLMGGAMSMDSSDSGTTICFTLSLRLPESKKDQSEPKRAAADVLPLRRRVLVAEDDETSLFVVRRMLEKWGFEVVAAGDGQQALDVLYQEDFHLVLMDVQMPVLDGVAATRMIRADPAFAGKAGVPIVAMTAYAMSGDREKFLAEGMNDYMSKPLELDELKAVLIRLGLATDNDRDGEGEILVRNDPGVPG